MPSPSARCWPSAAWSKRWTPRCPNTLSPSPPPPAPARRWPASASEPDRVFYCPLDLPWAVRAYLNALQPRLFILAETEFWPNLLSGCFRRKIPVAVVNARISDRSWPRYRRLRRLWRPFLEPLSRVLAQSQTDAERLKAIGCLPERVTVAGNLKFDVRAAEEADATRLLKTLSPSLRLIVAGSTLEGEEAALLEAWPRLLQADPQLAMVLAPRHPERFAAVAALLEKSGFSWVQALRLALRPRRFAQAAESRPDRSARHHRRAGLGLLAGLGGLRRRQPDSRRRTQPAGAGPVRRSHRDGPALCQLPRHYRGFAGPSGRPDCCR